MFSSQSERTAQDTLDEQNKKRQDKKPARENRTKVLKKLEEDKYPTERKRLAPVDFQQQGVNDDSSSFQSIASSSGTESDDNRSPSPELKEAAENVTDKATDEGLKKALTSQIRSNIARDTSKSVIKTGSEKIAEEKSQMTGETQSITANEQPVELNNLESLLNSDKAIILILMERLKKRNQTGEDLNKRIAVLEGIIRKLTNLRKDLNDTTNGIGKLLSSREELLGEFKVVGNNQEIFANIDDANASLYLGILIEKYKILIKKLSESINEKGDITFKLNELTSALQLAKSEAESKSAALLEAQSEAQSLGEEKKALSAELTKSESQIDQLNKDLIQISKETSQTINRLKESNEELEKQIVNSTGDKNKQLEIVKQMELKIAELETQISELDGIIEASNITITELNTKLEECEKSKVEILSNIEKLNKDHLKMILTRAKEENITFDFTEGEEDIEIMNTVFNYLEQNNHSIKNQRQLKEFLKNGFKKYDDETNDVLKDRIENVVDTYFESSKDNNKGEETSGGKRKTKKKKKSRKKRTLRRKNKSLKKKKRKTSKK